MRALSTLLLTLLVLLSHNPAQAAEFNPWEGPKPIAVLEKKSSWSDYVIDGKPALTIYEDGTAIFQKKNKNSQNYQYFSRKLSDAELTGVKDQMNPLFETQNLKPSYDLAYKIGRANFYLKQNNQERVVVVDGPVGTRYFHDPKEDLAEQKDTVESKLANLYNYLTQLPVPEDKEWVPKFIELCLYGTLESLDPAIPWPKKWPGLNSDRVRRLGALKVVFMDGNKKDEIDAFFKTNRNSKFLIDGNKFNFTYRPAFPNEPLWRKELKNHKTVSNP